MGAIRLALDTVDRRTGEGTLKHALPKCSVALSLGYVPPRLMLSKSRPHVSGTAKRTNTSVTMQSVP